MQFSPALPSEGANEHPAVILSIDELNRSRMPVVTVVPLTGDEPRHEGMLNVRLDPDDTNGLTKRSWAQPHLVRAVSKDLRLVRRRGALAAADLTRVEQALRDVLGL